jgi:hypothetical protein
MRPYGALNPIDQIPQIPDTVGAAIISSAGAIVTADWPPGVGLAFFNSSGDFWVNFRSTGVAQPSTNSAGTTLSSGMNVLNPGIRQVSTGDSTGYSVTAGTSGPISIEFWKK